MVSSSQNPAYWAYRGKPTMLLGGSDEDNPFQWSGTRLTDHLDAMVSCGANYVRNVLSDRDPGNAYAFRQTADGRYDLTAWNDEYWDRFDSFLRQTAEREIVVQLTLWDQYDIRGQGYDMRDTHPWHPSRNVNYHGTATISRWTDFFCTVERGNEEVLRYQRSFVLRVLETSLQYDHVLYNICNENFTSMRWDAYWAGLIHTTSGTSRVHVTAMQMSAEATVRATIGRTDLYSYADISQNNQDALGRSGPEHYATALRFRRLLSAAGPIPMNNEKIYGSRDGIVEAGTEVEATRRFWRNIFAGCAAARFHRPTWGLGLSDDARRMILAARMLLDAFDVFRSIPLNDLIQRGTASEAYCLAIPGEGYAVYLPTGGSVILDPVVYADLAEVRWLDVESGTWSPTVAHRVSWSGYAGMLATQKTRGEVLLLAPTRDVFTYRNQWVAVITIGEGAGCSRDPKQALKP